MTINLGNIAASDGFVIRYKAQSNYGLSDGEVVENDAALKGDQIQPYQAHFNLTYLEAGGSAEGYAGRLFVAFAVVGGRDCGSSAEGQEGKGAMIRDIW